MFFGASKAPPPTDRFFKPTDKPKFESLYTKRNERVYGVENGYMVTKYTFIDKL